VKLNKAGETKKNKKKKKENFAQKVSFRRERHRCATSQPPGRTADNSFDKKWNNFFLAVFPHAQKSRKTNGSSSTSLLGTR
jgi:hypothetical protein